MLLKKLYQLDGSSSDMNFYRRLDVPCLTLEALDLGLGVLGGILVIAILIGVSEFIWSLPHFPRLISTRISEASLTCCIIIIM